MKVEFLLNLKLKKKMYNEFSVECYFLLDKLNKTVLNHDFRIHQYMCMTFMSVYCQLLLKLYSYTYHPLALIDRRVGI